MAECLQVRRSEPYIRSEALVFLEKVARTASLRETRRVWVAEGAQHVQRVRWVRCVLAGPGGSERIPAGLVDPAGSVGAAALG